MQTASGRSQRDEGNQGPACEESEREFDGFGLPDNVGLCWA